MGKEKEILDHLKSNEIDEIRESKNDKNLNEALFKTVGYLLDEIDKLSRDMLSVYDEKETRRIFSFFGRVAQTACKFYQESKGHLDPVALKGEIGQRLETADREITEVNASLEYIEKTEADLLKKEKELNKRKEEYNKLTEKVTTLKKDEERLSNVVLKTLNDDIKALERENEGLEETIKQNQKTKTRLESKNKELETTHQALEKSVVEANAKEKRIEETIIKTIDAKLVTVEGIYTKYAKDLDSTKAKIENFKKQYSQLDDDVMKAQSDYNYYNGYLGENSKIVKKLREYGISEIDAFSSEMDNIKKHLKSELDRFDKIIKSVIEELEKQKEDIGRRNKTLL